MRKVLIHCLFFISVIISGVNASDNPACSTLWSELGAINLKKGISEAKLAEGRSKIWLDESVQIDGHLSDVVFNKLNEPIFIKFSGPTSLHENLKSSNLKTRLIPGQNEQRHGSGYSTPLGAYTIKLGDQTLSREKLDTTLLANLIKSKQKVVFEYDSGIILEGVLSSSITQVKNGKPMILIFDDCTLKNGDEILYQKEWGPFDLVLADSIGKIKLP